MLERLSKLGRTFVRSESAATATEYAVLIALVLLVVLGAVSALGDKVSTMFADADEGW